MSFFEPISGPDFDDKLRAAREIPGAVILDVRSAVEYAGGHVPGAVNVPLNQIPTMDRTKDTPLFLYCQNGARSQRGCKALDKLGFTRVTNLGGILDYRGPIEK